ncbi:hypothetical protein [Pseudomonas citronellolis]|uniref:hypothetical protein n=1 Tax=Pseudomonas citronellolis TaxID=53408 RepID=UPI0023E3CB78|nr:hypothetical protein [Pseudomonas citronellolis]MDF3935858.1 hypothetical protein [Pseudomonas citronellolis]
MSAPTPSFWKLTFGVALGIWLGCAAVALSAALLYRWLPELPAQVASRVAPPSAPTPQKDASEAMFQQYLANQRQLQAEQNQQAERSERDKRFNSAPCQFWRQQYQVDPSEKNRQKMDGYCG